MVSGEITASARKNRPKSVTSLLNDSNSDSVPHASLVEGPGVIDGSSEDPGYLALEASTATKEAEEDSEDPAESTAKRHIPDDEALPPSERTFGAYTLLRRLAFGGMGEVFLARRDANIEATLGVKAPGLARLVVIKRILGHMRRDEKHRRMFIDEARLQTALSSAHIVQVHDVGEIDGQVFLAMEHVHGPSWRALIDRCRKLKQHLSVPHVVEMMIQACDGLSYAHNLVDASTGLPLRIVHRDINPHNILVTYDGVVKVIDFGIAKSELREQQTETGTIKGKFAYMSPEQSAAEPLDGRSDLFAMGICLYELLTLTNPFKKGNIVLSLEAIQKLEPKPVGVLRPGAAVFQPLVERMLRKDPDDRFSDCAEVAATLRQLRQDGLTPEPKQSLQAWLRDLFAAEIQSHMRVLEATGSDVDVAVSSSVNLGQVRSFSGPIPVAREVAPDTPQPESLLPDGHGTGPTGALTVEKPRSNGGLYAASLAVGLAVCVAIVVGWRVLRPAPVVFVVADAGVVLATTTTPDVAPTAIAGAGIADAGSAAVIVDAGTVVASAEIDAGAVALDLPDGEAVTSTPKRPPRKPPTPSKDQPRELAKEPTDVAGRVSIAADGFLVKGARTVALSRPAVLVVDDKDAPFKLRMKVTVDDKGEAALALESEPWAIVRVDQVGRGKTPVAGVTLTSGRKTTLSLQNPSGLTMDVMVTFLSKN